MHHTRKTAGFTLVEMLVVIIVLAVLAALVVPNVFRHVGKAKSGSAQTQIVLLGGALEDYRIDNGAYPTTEQGLAALVKRPETAPTPSNWSGPYIKGEVPMDPWGAPFVYRSPTGEDGSGYELLTLGRDGKEGGTGENADVRAR